MNKPLKRHEALKPLSRDHHQGLLLCWKIREGLKNEVDTSRIVKYAKFFYLSHLVPHFKFEESQVFPLLEPGNVLVRKAIEEHRYLESLFLKNDADNKTLETLEKALEDHIRFEERILFMEIQKHATVKELDNLEKLEKEAPSSSPDDWEDSFWLPNKI